jgi:reverse transcriptase family protein (fragment)
MAITAKEYTTRPYNNTLQGMTYDYFGISMNSKERHEARYQRRKMAREQKRRLKLDRYDDFNRLSSPAALRKANWDTRKGVMFKASVIRYNMHYYRNSTQQSRDMRAGKDMRLGFYEFDVKERGKVRHIHSLHYAERVIRRSVCINALVPILSNNLIYDNGASLKGKGVKFAADRCETHLHKYFRGTGSNEGYVVVVDFQGYFNNIQHSPLYAILDRYLHDMMLNAISKGFIEATNWGKPKEKQGVGLYIGPEDSQIFAVAYPNSIDHIIKDSWQIKPYNRYMDDSYIIVKDKDTAQQILKRLFIEYDRLGIIPNAKKTQIIKLSKGFTFLKTRYFLTETGKVIRKPDHAAITRERRKLKRQHKLYLSGELTLEQVTQSYMSWRGSMKQRDAHRSILSMDGLYYDLFGVTPWKKNKKRRKYQHGKQS